MSSQTDFHAEHHLLHGIENWHKKGDSLVASLARYVRLELAHAPSSEGQIATLQADLRGEPRPAREHRLRGGE